MRHHIPTTLWLLALALAAPVISETPPSYQQIFQQVGSAYQAQDWPKCVERSLAAAAAATNDSQAARSYFAAAACSTAANDKEAAFGYLDKAAAKGHRSLETAEANPQIEPLRKDPRWQTFLEGVKARSTAYQAKVNTEVTRLYEEDQKDRQPGVGKIDWSVVSKRDTERLKRVQEIAGQGGLKESDDYYHAAMVLQHSDKLEDYDQAHQWCLKAVELGNERARWLAAATKDRWLMNQGKPQLYGTQFKKVDGKWILWEVDPSITDTERTDWNVPTLAEAKEQAKKMNEGG